MERKREQTFAKGKMHGRPPLVKEEKYLNQEQLWFPFIFRSVVRQIKKKLKRR